MTDNEIIKALEMHIDEFDKNGISIDNNRIDKLTLDLVTRQKAKIKRLGNVIDDLDRDLSISDDVIAEQHAEIIRLKSMNQSKLDTIHDLRTENEEFKIENQSLRGAANSYKLHYNEARAEAYKECIEKVKERICVVSFTAKSEEYADGYSDALIYVEEKLDDILKELVGEN